MSHPLISVYVGLAVNDPLLFSCVMVSAYTFYAYRRAKRDLLLSRGYLQTKSKVLRLLQSHLEVPQQGMASLVLLSVVALMGVAVRSQILLY